MGRVSTMSKKKRRKKFLLTTFNFHLTKYWFTKGYWLPNLLVIVSSLHWFDKITNGASNGKLQLIRTYEYL